jgi:hypothetical protein
MNKEVRPGFHNSFILDRFSKDEIAILRNLSKRWYLTNSGIDIRVGASIYKYALLKPTSKYAQAFGLERELCILFSDYSNFEPRTLDAFDAARSNIAGVRVDPICRILVSRDSAIEQKLSDLFIQEPEQPVVIPFTYSDLLQDHDGLNEFNRFRKHFFSRDLFSVQGPLQRDTFFFGRTKLIQELTDRFKTKENSGLFGLRKSGKTSIIYSIKRWAKENSEIAISIDCESPSIHGLRWYELLGKIVHLYYEAKQSQIKKPEARYDAILAADRFEADMLQIYRSKKASGSLLIFDEIERISFGTGSSSHWSQESDFLFFWQSIRAFCQQNPGILNLLLAGTNPQSVELSRINSHDNPLFSFAQPIYVPCFSFDQTKEMIEALGNPMGLSFSPLVLAKIQSDFGGHPFLTRQICSHIHKLIEIERPVTVDESIYQNAYTSFLKIGAPYLGMVVDVLREQYKDEYDLLLYLAQGLTAEYQSLSTLFQINHLEGYGLVEQQQDGPILKVNSIVSYLLMAHRYQLEVSSNEQRRSEIQERSSRLENALRSTIRRTLRTVMTEAKATTSVLESIPTERRSKLIHKSYKELLQEENSPLFLLDLKEIISKEWDSAFKNIFSPLEKARLGVYLEEINEMRRAPAHSNAVSADEFARWRGTMKQIETLLEAVS